MDCGFPTSQVCRIFSCQVEEEVHVVPTMMHSLFEIIPATWNAFMIGNLVDLTSVKTRNEGCVLEISFTLLCLIPQGTKSIDDDPEDDIHEDCSDHHKVGQIKCHALIPIVVGGVSMTNLG